MSPGPLSSFSPSLSGGAENLSSKRMKQSPLSPILSLCSKTLPCPQLPIHSERPHPFPPRDPSACRPEPHPRREDASSRASLRHVAKVTLPRETSPPRQRSLASGGEPGGAGSAHAPRREGRKNERGCSQQRGGRGGMRPAGSCRARVPSLRRCGDSGLPGAGWGPNQLQMYSPLPRPTSAARNSCGSSLSSPPLQGRGPHVSPRLPLGGQQQAF